MSFIGKLFFISKNVLIAILFIGFSSDQVVSQSTPDELEPAEYFDFWIGYWEVSWEEGEGETGSGTNKIVKILDGMVIQENFRITEGRNKGFKGTSISVYQTRFEQWKQAWADNNGGYFDFTGKFDGGKRIFQTETKQMENGTQFTQRMVFYDITENSFTWDWESSENGGETWKLNWRIFYNKMD